MVATRLALLSAALLAWTNDAEAFLCGPKETVRFRCHQSQRAFAFAPSLRHNLASCRGRIRKLLPGSCGGEGGIRTAVSSVVASNGAGGKRGTEDCVLIEQDGPAWTKVVWNEKARRFVRASSLQSQTNGERMIGALGDLNMLLRHWFIPDDVTPDYYSFTTWRVFQRFIAATVNVFGTQALLLALGIKSRRLGAAAAMSWVLKDALGKFGRVLWASKMGRKFDSDAKRWRFRSSLLYATGNGLEIITYVFPSSFLVLATAANSLKQMSMLTSSATRNTIYRSFARGENIGDITAKGEAQIAVVDLLGMLSGIGLCTAVGTSRSSIVLAYILLSLMDIGAIYMEIRAVVFSILNHERSDLVVRDFTDCGSSADAMVRARCTTSKGPSATESLVTGAGEWVKGGGKGIGLGEGVAKRGGVNEGRGRVSLLPGQLRSSPGSVARRENIFLPSPFRTGVFRTWSQAGVNMGDVKELLSIFGGEHYMLSYTKGRGASVILHRQATGPETLKSILALRYLQEELGRGQGKEEGCLYQGKGPIVEGDEAASWVILRRCLEMARIRANKNIDSLLDALEQLGWSTDKFMYGNIKTRVEWY